MVLFEPFVRLLRLFVARALEPTTAATALQHTCTARPTAASPSHSTPHNNLRTTPHNARARDREEHGD